MLKDCKRKPCKECQGTGYSSRIPLFEVLFLDEKISSIFHRGGAYGDILQAARMSGFTTMRYDGLRKALAGITSLDEVLRVS